MYWPGTAASAAQKWISKGNARMRPLALICLLAAAWFSMAGAAASFLCISDLPFRDPPHIVRSILVTQSIDHNATLRKRVIYRGLKRVMSREIGRGEAAGHEG